MGHGVGGVLVVCDVAVVEVVDVVGILTVVGVLPQTSWIVS